MLTFRRESSQTRIRRYTLARTIRAERILTLGRWFTAGAGVVAGGVWSAWTVALNDDATVVEPARFFAVTTNRSVWPTSAARTPYVVPVAPAASVQPAPDWSQRCHWDENERTPPVHAPRVAVNSAPTWAVPEIVGLTVFFGATLDEIASVAVEFAELCPSVFDAVTTTLTVWSTSFSFSTYVRWVALSMSPHDVPSAAQRCQR
jgi:hypothetical protein